MVRLVVTDSAGAKKEYSISKEMVIGRNKENDVRIKEEKASRRHCRLRPDGNRVLLEDLESSNGTRVNGQKIKNYVLKHGDKITIGKTQIVFEDEDQQLDRTMALPSIDHVLPDEAAPASAKRPARASAPAIKPAVVAEKEEDEDDDDDRDDVVDEDNHDEEEPNHAEDDAKAVAVKAAPASAGSGASTREKVRAARRDAGPEDESELHHYVKMAGPVVALIAFIVTVLLVISYEKEWKVASKVGLVSATDTNTNTAVQNPGQENPPPPPSIAPPPPVMATTQPPPIAPPPLPASTSTQSNPVPPVDKPNDADLTAQLTKVLADRDKAIASGNYPAARAGVRSFASAHPEGTIGAKARQEWKDTVAQIEAMLEPVMTSARKAAADKKYSLATQHCTRLLSADPSGKYGEQARELLSNIDLETEPRFEELRGQAHDLLQAGKLKEAGETLGRALSELGGTKWGATISADQLQVVAADALLERIENERQKRASAGKETILKLPSKKIEGPLAKVRGVTFEIKMDGGGLQIPLKGSIDPTADFGNLVDSLGVSASRIDRAYLWLVLGRKDAARAEVDAALRDPVQASAAAGLASVIFEDKNFHAWDFSKWQHQSDWDALSGSWSTQNGQFVLESPEGGDTTLKTEAIGGKYAAAKARISFDFELTGPKDGYLFAFEFGSDEQHAISAIFNASGVTLSTNLGSPSNVNDKNWKPGPTHVDVSIQGETFNVSVNGKALQGLQVQGLTNLLGTITFRVRESAGYITHVILRHAD